MNRSFHAAIFFLLATFFVQDARAQRGACPGGGTIEGQTITASILDNFAQPGEPAIRGTLLDSLYSGWTNFDHQGGSGPFGYTFQNLPCLVRGLSLRVRATPLNRQAYDDTVQVGIGGRGWLFEGRFRQPLDRPWTGPEWFTFDISHILPNLRDPSSLNVLIRNDTSIDAMELVVAYCAFDDCNQNCVSDQVDIAEEFSQDINGNGVPDECEDLTPPTPEFICQTDVLLTADQNCCATTTLSPSVANVTGNYVITNSLDPSQTGSLTYCFPLGVTVVSFTLTPENQPPISCRTVVIVTDNQGPLIMPVTGGKK